MTPMLASPASPASLEDPFLKALNGELPPLAPGETAPVLDSKEDPLETRPLPTPPILAKADAQHSTKVGGKGFAVTVRGDYYAASADIQGKKVKKPYEITVNLPALESALSIIKNKLLDAAIKRKHPESLGARTHEIVSAIPLSPETQESNNLQFMNRPALERFASDQRIPILITEYLDVVVLRATIIDWVQNPKGFAEREALKQKDRKETAELNRLNPELTAV